MSEQLELSIELPASAQRIYTAWLDNASHTRFTGSAAVIDARVGGRFTAWNGYISGETLALEPYTRILQSWRTAEFPAEAPDSPPRGAARKQRRGHPPDPVPYPHPRWTGAAVRTGLARLLFSAHAGITSRPDGKRILKR